MNKTSFSFLVLILLAGASLSASAQSLTFDNSLTFGSNDFTTDSQGVSWLTLDPSSSAFHQDLDSFLGVSSASGILGAGWVFDDGTNRIVISEQNRVDSMVADPFVSYGYAFIHSPSGPDTFSMSFTSNFAPVSPDETGLVRATFGLSLTDGNSSGSSDPGVSADAVQSGQLSGLASSIDAGVTLDSGLQTAKNGATKTAQFQTLNAPEYIPGPGGGPYDSLTATVSGTYSSGSILVVSGRIDAIPEPSSFALFAGSASAVMAYRLRRISRS